MDDILILAPTRWRQGVKETCEGFPEFPRFLHIQRSRPVRSLSSIWKLDPKIDHQAVEADRSCDDPEHLDQRVGFSLGDPQLVRRLEIMCNHSLKYPDSGDRTDLSARQKARALHAPHLKRPTKRTKHPVDRLARAECRRVATCYDKCAANYHLAHNVFFSARVTRQPPLDLSRR